MSLYYFIKSNEREWKTLIFSTLFFLCPILIGFVYSHFFGSALMDRVLYFSAPFFFSIPFMAIPKMKNSVFTLAFILVVGVSASTTLTTGVFIERQYVENFRAISMDIDDAYSYEQKILEQKNVGVTEIDIDERFLQLGNYNSSEYLNYFRPENLIEFDMWDIDTDQKLAKYMKYVRNSTKESMILSWACKYQPIATIEYAKVYFPNLVTERSYYNSGMWHLNKESAKRDALYFKKLTNNTLIEGKTEYFDLLKIDGSKSNLEVINVSIDFETANVDGLLLVYSETSKSGESVKWKGHHFSDFITEKNQNQIFMSFKLPLLENKGNEISIYIWNSKHIEILLKNIEITSFADSHYPGLY